MSWKGKMWVQFKISKILKVSRCHIWRELKFTTKLVLSEWVPYTNRYADAFEIEKNQFTSIHKMSFKNEKIMEEDRMIYITIY